MDRRSLNEKLGKCDFTLGFVLLLSLQNSSQEQANLSSVHLPNPSNVLTLVREFTSWIIRGRTAEESSVFFIHSIDLSFIFLRYSQYNAIQVSSFVLSIFYYGSATKLLQNNYDERTLFCSVFAHHG